MSIITISRGSYSRGKEVAEKLAQQLNYESINRDILLEASSLFHIPEIKLIRAIHDAPSILERFSNGKEQYVSYIRYALLKHAQKDNVVYHGLAGHFFLQEIPHVLKVRIIANMEDRIKEEMKRENISAEEARHVLKKDDDERRKWGLYLYGADTRDSRFYDIVLNVKNMSVDNAVELILQAVQLPCFQTTPESQKILDDMVLTSQLQEALVHQFPTVEVAIKKDGVFVNVTGHLNQKAEITRRIEDIIHKTAEVGDIEVNVSPQATVASLRSSLKMLHFD
jgi:cytidylate kinase